jgi:phosphonate degradation associated HDIG domain protein
VVRDPGHAGSTVSDLDGLVALYETRGREPYGEALTQTQHALQCAALARRAGASDALVVAALFHDVGHLVADLQNDAAFTLAERDDDHELIGARVLAPLFGPAVALPVSLHVTAKRWRCTREPHYFDLLSAASRHTLVAQGGPLSEGQCRRFEAHPGFHAALDLRSWDDQGKIEGLDVGAMSDYEELITTTAAAWSRGRLER